MMSKAKVIIVFMVLGINNLKKIVFCCWSQDQQRGELVVLSMGSFLPELPFLC